MDVMVLLTTKTNKTTSGEQPTCPSAGEQVRQVWRAPTVQCSAAEDGEVAQTRTRMNPRPAAPTDRSLPSEGSGRHDLGAATSGESDLWAGKACGSELGAGARPAAKGREGALSGDGTLICADWGGRFVTTHACKLTEPRFKRPCKKIPQWNC